MYLEQLSEEQRKLVLRHLELVVEANKTTNLTRIDDWDEALLLHIEDSLAALEEINDCKQGPYADIGSGAGFPGIPLAIATGRKTTLVDARQKKMKVVDGIIESLGLEDQVRTFAGRAELLARSESNCFAVVTARALAKLSVLMELASPLLMKGGMLVCYKANLEDEELNHAKSIQKKTGMNIKNIRHFKLADEYDRTIVTIEKAAKPTIPLPRLEGQAQKNPL